MNFFERQEKARSSTSMLLLLFGLAVTFTILGVYLVVRIALMFMSERYALSLPSASEQWWQAYLGDPILSWVIGFTVALVTLVSAYRMITLGRSGKAVAEYAGARAVDPATKDEGERRLLNVVEEMSIASGTPPPRVYLMDDQPAINAFAAGYEPNDAAIAVSSGCLKSLTRDELQGVIGHEFSHIFNGDMRLNVRLIGWLAGLLVIGRLGLGILRMRGRGGRAGGGAGLLGIGLAIVGFIGLFFGYMIKAAVSRQREFLADASSVQFTRNPDGIASALIKIRDSGAGSLIYLPRADEISHMFFSQGVMGATFATHPPIDERIRAIKPAFAVPTKGAVAGPSLQGVATAPPGASAFAGGAAASQSPGQLSASIGNPTAEHLALARTMLDAVPAPLRAVVHEAAGARAVVCSLFVDPAPGEVRDKQILSLRKAWGDAAAKDLETHGPIVRGMGVRLRLPLVELCVPAFRELPSEGREQFLGVVSQLIYADKRFELHEFALQAVLTAQLSDRPAPRSLHRVLGPLFPDCAILLSLLAYGGAASLESAEPAYLRGVRVLTRQAIPISRPVDLTPDRVHAALAAVRDVTPKLKERVVKAFTECAITDDKITLTESELLRALTISIGCPMPPLV